MEKPAINPQTTVLVHTHTCTSAGTDNQYNFFWHSTGFILDCTRMDLLLQISHLTQAIKSILDSKLFATSNGLGQLYNFRAIIAMGHQTKDNTYSIDDMYRVLLGPDGPCMWSWIKNKLMARLMYIY